MDFVRIAVELLFGYIALFLLTKVLGKTQITQITAFDFISSIVLGELVGNALYDNEIGIEKILFAIVFWGLLIYLTEMLTQKFKASRTLFEGRPSIIINKGQIIRDMLTKNKLDINQLQHLLRAKDIFSIREVEFAILETDGSISVMKKYQNDTPVRNDFSMPEQKLSLPITLIIDGEPITDNFREAGYSEDRLLKEIKKFGASDFRDVLFAEWKEQEGLFLQKI